jgi:hypothetical protein
VDAAAIDLQHARGMADRGAGKHPCGRHESRDGNLPLPSRVHPVRYVDANQRQARKLRLPLVLPLLSRVSRLPLLLATALALVVFGFGGCGGGDGGGDSGQNVTSVLNDTFGGKTKINSGVLKLVVNADLKGVTQLQGPVAVKLGGPFESRGKRKVPKLDLDLTATSGGQTFTAGVLSTGERGYINFQGDDYALQASTFDQFKRELQQAKQSESSIPDLTALGVNPRNWLKDPSDEGTEDVNGVEAVHITAGVDVAKLLADVDHLLSRTNLGRLGLTQAQQQQLPKSIPASVKKQIQDAVKEAHLDVYTGKKDKILRKLVVKLRFEVPAKLRSQASGLRSGTIDFTLEVADLNKPQTINAPKQARPFSELQRLLNASGLGAAGASSSGSGSTSGAASSGSGTTGGTSIGTGAGAQVDKAKARKYLKCLEDAGTQEQLTGCSALLK